MKPIEWDKIEEKENVCNRASELYNTRFKNYCDQYDKLSDDKKISIIKKSFLKT